MFITSTPARGLSALRRVASLLTSRAGSPPVEQLEQRQLLTFVAQPIDALSDSLTAVVVADFNGDGLDDIAGYRGEASSRVLRLHLANGVNSFADGVTISNEPVSFFEVSNSLFASDFDGDGDADLVLGNGATWLNDGAGAFSAGGSLPNSSTRTKLIAGDFIAGGGGELIELEIASGQNQHQVLRYVSGAWERFGTPYVGVSALSYAGVGNFVQGSTTQQLLVSAVGVSDTNSTAELLLLSADELGRLSAAVITSELRFPGPNSEVRDWYASAADVDGDGWSDIVAVRSLTVSTGFVPGTRRETIEREAVTYRSTPTGFVEFARSNVINTGIDNIIAVRDVTGDGIADLIGSSRVDLLTPRSVIVPGLAPGRFDASRLSVMSVSVDGQRDGRSTLGIINHDGGPAELVQAATRFSTNATVAISRVREGGGLVTTVSAPTRVVWSDTITIETAGMTSVDGGAITDVRIVRDDNRNGLFDLTDTTFASLDLLPSGSSARFSNTVPKFQDVGTQQYFVVAGTALGERLNQTFTIATWSRIFYPEGFKNQNINEHIPLVNDNDEPVDYRIVIRYGEGERDQVVETGTLAPRSRSGYTTSTRGNVNTTPLRAGVPYAVEVQSSKPVGAMMVRYDTAGRSGNAAAAGEAFTSEVSRNFAITGLSTRTFDFVTYFNPQDTDTTLTFTAYESQGRLQAQQVFTTVLGANRRGGVLVSALLTDAMRGLGVSNLDNVTIVVTSSVPHGISVAMSSHDPVNRRSATTLAEPYGALQASSFGYNFGATEVRNRLDTTLSLANLSGEFHVVNVVVTNDQGVVRTRSVAMTPWSSSTVNIRDLTPAGSRVVSVDAFTPDMDSFADALPFVASLSSNDRSRGDRLVAGSARIDSEFLFADGFLNRNQLGRRSFASLLLTNFTNVTLDIQVDFYFPDGTTRQATYSVAPLRPRAIELHRESVLISKPGLDFYAMRVSSMTISQGFSASMYHADLNQGGAWLTQGQAVS
jgi:hypothetical protein